MTRAGFVYAIVADEFARVKIGIAVRPVCRLRELATGAPTPLRLHAAVHHFHAQRAEAELHRQFAGARVCGEWFDATDPAVAEWMAEHLLAQEAMATARRVGCRYEPIGRLGHAGLRAPSLEVGFHGEARRWA